MKRISMKILFLIFAFSITSICVYADMGDMGYFGGISEGTNLPKTIEKYVPVKLLKTRVMRYKEMVYISGEPIEFEGTIKVTKNDDVIDTKESGSYSEKYVISAKNLEKNSTLDRTINFTTSFYYVDGDFKKQIVRDSTVSSWTEKIVIDDVTYTLDDTFSIYSLTGVEDITPGVSYYDTSVSYEARFLSSNNETITIKTEGSVYGYDQPWSKVESGKLTMDIIGPKDRMQVTLNPSLEAKKTMYYDKTSPFPISFDGTYNQRLEREASLKYNITTNHPELTRSQMENSMMISTAKQIEKLPIPAGLDFLDSNPANEHMKKLYSMEIMTEIPHKSMELEAITRGEFIKAICLAMNMDTSKYQVTSKNKNSMKVIFGDVLPDNPLYPYIMTAYNAKLIKGVGDIFKVSQPITRQEALCILIRVIGLEKIGKLENSVTPFKDDNMISPWARKAILAGYKLGIIEEKEGNLEPRKWLSKIDASAIIDNLINYLREDISGYYRLIQ
ncbi:S-layer homology domain-containing protein [Vallitalea guaymasensis]|uniref:S-layer homology domain-containing protein n=1 Tax=Vallitalea guaymasensis TaxID=1185412 RepID=UPI000DE38449|nr:S-layer homology domain-containing protein [Vallitalea guaymasensis]